jgi:mono/diheme cytochrome c family protein
LLTSQQPSRQFLTSAVGQGSIVQVERTPGLTIVFATDPRVLENARYQVTLTEGFEPVTDAEAVRLRFRNLLAPLGISDLEAQYLGSGIYVAQGTPTPVDGFWEAEVQVVRPNRVDAAAQFRYPTGRSLQFAQGDGWRLPPLDGLTFGGIGLLLLGILALRFRTRVRQQVLRNLMFGLAAFGFLAGGTALTSHAHTVPPNVAGLVNPVPATAQSVNTGRLLYEANCLACHGVRGRGDGPLARSLNPPPLDLMVHGPVHTDGELFGWISEGVTGTAMPSFADRLTETERWHLVNYLRSITAAPR